MNRSPQTTIRVAFGSVPKDGGTFTFYRNQRPALLEKGIELMCVSVGAIECDLWDSRFEDDGCVQLVPHEKSIQKQAEAFVDWCVKREIDIVIGINSAAILSALPHLPEHIRVMARCANAFDHGYRITLSGRERLARIVALTPRLRDDLVSRYDANPNIMELIPNGIDPAAFDQVERSSRAAGEPLRLGFLGRLEHKQKGVLYLPAILGELDSAGVDYRMRIAGKGKHGRQLERELSTQIENGSVEMTGAISPPDVPAFLGQTDIFLFTSHFEGCPNALLEAMMAGCVPVSWLIDGITDFVIAEDNETGFLVPPGDTKQFADTIIKLAHKPSQIIDISNRTSREARARFTNQICAAEYSRVFHEVMSEPPPPCKPRPWTDFRIDPAFEPSKWGWIPMPIKSMIKTGVRTITGRP